MTHKASGQRTAIVAVTHAAQAPQFVSGHLICAGWPATRRDQRNLKGTGMEGFDPRTSFGYEESKRYDAVDTRGDEEETVAFLARLAGQRDALEFAVGTGSLSYHAWL